MNFGFTTEHTHKHIISYCAIDIINIIFAGNIKTTGTHKYEFVCMSSA